MLEAILTSSVAFLSLALKITFLFSIRSGLAVGAGFLILRATAFGRDRKIYKMRYGTNQLRTELFSMMKVVPFYSVLISIAMFFELIHFSAFSWWGTALTFSTIFVWNEMWFYGLHRALHHPRLMFIHKDHHRSPVASPLSIASFSLTEQSTHVFCALFWPVVTSTFMPITFEGLALYSLFQISVNILGHMNVEIYPAEFAEKGLGQWVTTPTFHSLHHGRVRGHYGLLTTIPDRLFGTFFEDYAKVQTRAAQGNGLTRASERLTLDVLTRAVPTRAVPTRGVSQDRRGISQTSRSL